MNNPEPLASRLNSRLFWDTDIATFDPEAHSAFIVGRVLTYGTWEDWKAIREYYGFHRLREIVQEIRTLPPNAIAFCCTAFDLEKEALRCYIETQSNPAYLTWQNG